MHQTVTLTSAPPQPLLSSRRVRARWRSPLALVIALGAAMSPGARAGEVTLVNHLDRPLPRSAIAVAASALYEALEIDPGTPLAAGPVPVFLHGDEIVFHAALEAGERKTLALSSAPDWAPPAAASSGEGAMSNGILGAAYEDGGFRIDFSRGSILGQLRWDGAVSIERLGPRQSLPALRGMGAPRSRALEDGGSEMVVEGEMEIEGGGRLRISHVLRLLPHQPVAEYRVRLANTGARELFIADSIMHGAYGELLEGELELHEPRGTGSGDFQDLDFSAGLFTRMPLHTTWAQRPRRWGHIPNSAVISPETGYALGFSSLGLYGRVWMNAERWIYGPERFQMRAIAEGACLPIPIPAGATVEVGNFFYAFTPDNMAFEETVQAFRRICEGQPPALAASAAVLAGGRALKPQFVRRMEQADAGPGLLPLRVDLGEQPRLRLAFGPDAASGEVRLSDPEGRTEIRRAVGPNSELDYDLGAVAGASAGPRDITLGVQAGLRVASVQLAPRPPDAPMLEMPVEGMHLTDIASSFKWKGVPGFGRYELEAARDRDFKEVILRDAVSLGDVAYGHYQCLEKLPAGVLFWRVRVEGGPWSAIGSFNVNRDYAARPPSMRPAEGEPFYTFWLTDVEGFLDRHGANPIVDELCGNSAIITYLDSVGWPGQSARRDTQRAREHDVRIAYRSLCLADVEWAFQQLPNVIGYVDGENLGSLLNMGSDSKTPGRLTRRQFFRLVELCAKYGRYFVFGDGGFNGYVRIGVDPEWHDLMARHGRNVLLGYKSNISWYMHAAADANMGLYLSGIFPIFYWETENWYWDHAGFRELGSQHGLREGIVEMHPAMFANLQVLAGLARGAGSFKIEAAVEAHKHPEDNYELNRIILPFLRALVERGMVPTREEVLENIKVAVVLPRNATSINLRDSWGPFEPLYEATYGLGAHAWHNQLWPDNSRYYFIPVRPIGTKELPGVDTLVPLEELTTVEKVRAVFDPLYPPIEGDAFRAVLGDKIFIMPGRENEDRVYTYGVPLEGGAIAGLEGKIGPMQYLIGRRYRDGDEIWLQSDAAITRWTGTGPGETLAPRYEFPDAEFAILAAAEPALEVTPREALKSATWAEGKLHLVISHEHGAVEIRAGVENPSRAV